MVYRGKPSKGCSVCRKRRVQCDRASPGCGNCKRYSVDCPGYRDELDVLFHNETVHTIEKASGNNKNDARGKADLAFTQLSISGIDEGCEKDISEPQKMKADVKAVQSIPFSNISNRSLSQLPGPSRQPYFSVDDLSTGFFVLQYVSRGHTISMESVNNPRSGPAEALSASMKAIGCAGLASFQRSIDYSQAMKKLYGNAVRSLNLVLKSPEASIDDNTLLAVILLYYCENLEWRKSSNTDARLAHLNGAVSLLQLRGPQRLRNQPEILLFAQLCSALTNFCVENHLFLPQIVVDLAEHVNSYIIEKTAVWHYGYTKVKFTQFYIKSINDPISDLDNTLETALEFDQDFKNILTLKKSAWTHDESQIKTPNPSTGDSRYEVHDSSRDILLSNGVQTCRLLLHQLIHNIIQKLLGSDDQDDAVALSAQLQETRMIMRNVQHAILSSVTEHLGIILDNDSALNQTGNPNLTGSVPMRSASYTTSSSITTEAGFLPPTYENVNSGPTVQSATLHSSFPLIRIFGGYSLPWSLFVVGTVDLECFGHSTEPYSFAIHAIQILEHISKSIGVRRADIFADALRTRSALPINPR